MKLILITLAIAGIHLSPCVAQNSNASDRIKEIILNKYENVRTTLRNGDPTYVLNMHAEDATLFLQNGKEVVHLVELKPFYEKIATMGIDINSTPTTVELLADDVAYEVGTFTSTSRTGVQNSAKYINVWKKIEGDWKLYKAIDQAKLENKN